MLFFTGVDPDAPYLRINTPALMVAVFTTTAAGMEKSTSPRPSMVTVFRLPADKSTLTASDLTCNFQIRGDSFHASKRTARLVSKEHIG